MNEIINRSAKPIDYLSKEPYVFSNSAVVTGNSTGQITFTIDGSFDYEFFKFSYKSTGAFKIQFVNDSKVIFKNPISNGVFSGLEGSTQRGQLIWHTFKIPYKVFRNTNLIANITDISGSTNNIEIVVDGIKYIYTV